MKMDYEKVLAVAKEAALTAGNYLRENFDQKPEIEYKSDIELVTEKDRESQQIIYQISESPYKNFRGKVCYSFSLFLAHE